MEGKSETHLIYARFLLNQIRDTPAFINKNRCVFLDARLPFMCKARRIQLLVSFYWAGPENIIKLNFESGSSPKISASIKLHRTPTEQELVSFNAHAQDVKFLSN
jgi:hypothetical protein